VQAPAQAGSAKAGCPGPCPVRFCISPQMEASQPLWASCSSSEWTGDDQRPDVSMDHSGNFHLHGKLLNKSTTLINVLDIHSPTLVLVRLLITLWAKADPCFTQIHDYKEKTVKESGATWDERTVAPGERAWFSTEGTSIPANAVLL